MTSPLTLIRNATAILPDRLLPNARLLFRNGRILEVTKDRTRVPRDAHVIDARGGYLSPGFIDIHVHGGGGADFMDGTPAAVRTACRTHLRHGTTTLFPTTTTGTPAEIHALIDACRVVRDESLTANTRPTNPPPPISKSANKPISPAASPAVSRIAGIHLYGPFFAPDKVGCHAPEGRRNPTSAEFGRYFATGLIRIATCAAELPGAAAFYRAARRHQCLITCGHSNASWTEMGHAFRAGLRHVDHFWCAMSSVPSVRARLGTPMQGSMEQYVLLNRAMSTEVIADGEHLADELLEFAWRMLGPERLLLVTDSSRALDLPPGRYKFGHHTTGTDFDHDGRVGRAPGGSLASSAMGMDHMVRVMKARTTAPWSDIIRMATLTPAERTGIAADTGSLTPGKRADLLLLSPTLRVREVWLDGTRA